MSPLRLRIQMLGAEDRVLAQVDIDNVPENLGASPGGVFLHPDSDRWKKAYFDYVFKAARAVYEAATGRIV